MEQNIVMVTEPELGTVTQRSYMIVKPLSWVEGGEASGPTPVFFWIHGQYSSAEKEAQGWVNESGLGENAKANDFLLIVPDGLKDPVQPPVDANGIPSSNGSPDLGTGWNVGAGGDERTCIIEPDTNQNGTTLYGVQSTEYSCYSSCITLNQCGRCNWSTCHDDIAFLKAILTQLSEEFCLDLSRLYLGGESNGGMLTHKVSQELPNTFAAFMPVFGLPLIGYITGKNGELLRNVASLQESAFLTIHDRQDQIIPMNGKLAPLEKWSWYYESVDAVASVWSGIHGCSVAPVNLTLDDMDHDPGFECVEFEQCKSERRVIRCLYNGYHGKVPEMGIVGNLGFWFFNQFRRNTPVSW